MASIRAPALRHLAACSSLRGGAVSQRRWAQVHDVRFLVTQQPSQAVVDKYRAKLERKARQEGHDGIDGLKSAYADKIAAQRRQDAVDLPATSHIPQVEGTPVSQPMRGPLPSQTSSRFSSTATPAAGGARAAPGAPPTASGKPAVKTLGEMLDLDKVRELPEKELTAIWRLRNANSPHNICAVIPAATYQAMEGLARTSPRPSR